MSIRLLVLFVRHGTAKYPGALEELQSTILERLRTASTKVVVIDNALSGQAPTVLGPNTVLLAGDNRVFEFSGWDLGLRELGDETQQHDLVLLATEAFAAGPNTYLQQFNDRALRLALDNGAAVGCLDAYPEPIRVAGFTSQTWLRSSLILMPLDRARQLHPLAHFDSVDTFFGHDAADPFRPDAPIDDNYRAFLCGWLTGVGKFTGGVYHSQFQLTPAKLPYFKTKCLCIVNEHFLTIRLRTLGSPIIDLRAFHQLDQAKSTLGVSGK